MTQHLDDAPKTARLLLDTQHALAEGAHWSHHDDAFYWTDIEGKRLWRHGTQSGATESWPMPERLACFTLCEDSRYLLLGLASRLAFFCLDSGAITHIADVEAGLNTRLNDGKCDRAGNFVFGMKDEADSPQAIGGFYRLNADLHLERLPLPFAAIANSIAFSPDGSRMYYCDSLTRTIRCCDYRPDALPSNDRLFVETDDSPAEPDGAAIDADGGLWSARFGGASVVRHDPEGRVTDRIAVPTTQPTCVAFGGPTLETLYVTSARIALDADALADDPHAGGIFAIQPGQRGLLDTRFQGHPGSATTQAHDASASASTAASTTSNTRPARTLRSQAWFGIEGKDGFIHRSWMKNQGIPHDAFDGRPVIGICNTWSELTPCNAHFRELAEYVKRGVRDAGGIPLEFPVMSLGETNLRPTAMLFRNLASMDVEESIRGNPIDGVILMVGCDKTTPALLMGAASCNVPAIAVSGGAMLNGRYRGGTLGSGTGVWQMSEAVRAGEMSKEAFVEAESCMNRSRGHCMTMGTASTMASMVEALGIGLPQNAAIPAVDSRRQVLAQMAGRRIVDMVRDDVTMDKILTRPAFENAIRTNAAIGGSTNAVVHLIALARRIGIELSLDDWELGSDVPCLVNLQPSGEYLMEDFYYAGGLPVVLRRLDEAGLLHRDALTVNGKSIGENVADAECFNEHVITSFAEPFKPQAGIAVLRGNLAPRGAVIKPSAASPHLLKHRGRAVVFENIEELHARIDDEALDIDEHCVMVLKGAGPRGYPGFAEVGNMPLPAKVLRRGITDMVRISDGRMSGTAYGAVVLHVSPEAAAGGPLALVQTGDMIELDVAARRLHLDVDDAELARRREAWHAPAPPERGYYRLYVEHVLQADEGCDLDFLVGGSGAAVPRDSH